MPNDSSAGKNGSPLPPTAVVVWAVDRLGNYTLTQSVETCELGLFPANHQAITYTEFHKNNPSSLENFKRVLDGQTIVEESKVKGRWYRTQYLPMRDPQNAVTGMIGLSTDIDSQKIRQFEFEKNVDDSPAILWITERDGSCSYLSKQWYAFTGQTEQQALGRGWLETVHPDDVLKTRQHFAEVSENKNPFYLEYRLRTASGQYHWVIGAANQRRDRDGNYLGYAGTVFDIHEQKMAQLEVQEKQSQLAEANQNLETTVAERTRELSLEQEFLKALLENASDGIVACDAEGKLTVFNRATRDIHGLPEQPLPPDQWAEHYSLFEADGVTPLKKEHIPLYRAFNEGRVENAEMVVAPRNQPKSILIANGQAIVSSGGKKLGAVVIMRDVTDLKKAETERLRLEREKQNLLSAQINARQFQTLANSMSQLAWMAHPEGDIFWYNQRWFDYTGTTLNQMKGWGWKDVHHPEHLDRVVEKISAFWNGGWKQNPVWEDTFPIRGADGKYRWFLSRMLPITDDHGEVIRWFGTNTDITEVRILTVEIERSRERYRQVFEFSPIPMWVFDIHTFEFIDVNETALNHYGYSKEEFLGMKASDIRPSEDLQHFNQAMDQASESGKPFSHGRYQHIKKDGTVIHVEVSTHDIEIDDRQVRMAAIVDVTKRVEIEAEKEEVMRNLQMAKDEAERTNQLKSAFLANMSHEIRTPLGVVTGFTDLILDPHISESERYKYAEILKRNVHQMTILINDILDLSKVEAGHLTIDPSIFSIRTIAEDSFSVVRASAEKKGIHLNLTTDQIRSDMIYSDSVRLKQILTNLVGNAVKFTEKGEVTLAILEVDGKFIIEVSDTGIGINGNDAKKLFKPFSQADESMTRKYGGTGLGLALSKRLAQLLGGDLILKSSTLGKGSTFALEVRGIDTQKDFSKKKQIANQALSSQARNVSLEGVRVLLVEDSADNQELISRILKKKGAQVVIVNNGQEGIDAALRESFDLVVMDIQMPVMDGYTATQQLRALGYRKPIIALTAHAMSEVRQRCLEVGYTDHLSKPINTQELIESVSKHSLRIP